MTRHPTPSRNLSAGNRTGRVYSRRIATEMSGGADSRCPRCGGAFHCGVNDVEPCACTALLLDDATLTDLRQRYDGCLCLGCLRAINAIQRTPAPEP